MDKEDLKKYTCINLRCVTQSSKEGVPLNQLQNDYRQLLGTAIPFKELGYSSLEHFLLNIPDVVCLKKKADGSVIVEGIADASTAHIAKLISKQKSSKKSKSGSAKPAVVTRKWGSCAKKNSNKNLISSQKDFNISPPNTSDIKHDQNSKLMQLSSAQKELKKSVLIHLRSVVQSCKQGIPLNRLQKDYRKFIGSYIPFENLGYSTLYEFIKSIPDVIELKEGYNEQFIAVGVVDKATAHLFPDTLKSKPLNPPTVQSKPSVNNKASLQISSEQKAKLHTSFNTSQNVSVSTDVNNILKYPTSISLEDFISKKLLENAEQHPSTEEIKKHQPLKVAKPAINSVIKSATLSRTDTISLHNQKKPKNQSNESSLRSENIVSTVNPYLEHHNRISVWEDTVEKDRPISSCSSSTSSKSDIQHAFNCLIQPEETFNGVSSKSLDQDGSLKVSNSCVVTKEDKKPSNKENPVILETKKSKKAKRKAERVQNEIKSNLAWIYFALYVPSSVETLKKELQSFHGFPFSKDSTEWKERKDIISLLPKAAVKSCLNQFGIKFNSKGCRTSLQNKLMDYFASYTKESGTEQRKIEQKDKEKELYASTLTLSSVSSDILPKCSSYCDTENSDAILSDTNFDVPKAKSKISDSDMGCTNQQNPMRENSDCLQKNKKSVQAQQPNNKGNLLNQKSSSKKVKPVSEKQQPLDKTLAQKLNEESSKTKSSTIVSSKKVKIKVRQRKRKRTQVAEKNNGVSVIKPIET